ncbi:hypothetical protein [Corynebacterium auris]|nr:hypothetical protein [Corynebacterium auris]
MTPALLSRSERRLRDDSPIYWGEAEGHTFRIGSVEAEPFWEYFRRQASCFSDVSNELRLIRHVDLALEASSAFSEEAEIRYSALRSECLGHLPRDFWELRLLLGDPLVVSTFSDSGLNVSSVQEILSLVLEYLSGCSKMVHGCFRLRNIIFTPRERLAVIAGDDVVYGSNVVPIAAILSDLFELVSSGAFFLERPLISLYRRLENSVEDQKVLEMLVFLYAVAHSAQYIHTYKVRGRVSTVRASAILADRGLLAAVRSAS